VAGDRISAALKTDGTVVAWGLNFTIPFPTGLANVKALSCNGTHMLALKTDGTVVAWGNNGNGQSIVPAGLTGVTAVAAGGFHSIALKSDGSVAAWGSNSQGQALPPAAISRAYALAATAHGNFALVAQALAITEQPASKTIGVGGNTTFTATAKGAGAISYQWNKNGVAIPGATNATLTVSSAQAANAGQYTVTVTDATSSVTSSAGTLTVSPTPPAADSRLYAIPAARLSAPAAIF